MNDSRIEATVATKALAPDILDHETALKETRETMQFACKMTYKRDSLEGNASQTRSGGWG